MLCTMDWGIGALTILVFGYAILAINGSDESHNQKAWMLTDTYHCQTRPSVKDNIVILLSHESQCKE